MPDAPRSSGAFPFAIREIAAPDAHVVALFDRSFRSPPPDFPRHFVAIRSAPDARGIAGYIHFTVMEPGVFLCGGLCVDARVYRTLAGSERETVAREGSLSRWLLNRSTEALGAKRAVFAYTGDRRSRVDGFAAGYVPAGRYLIVQWHDEPESGRGELLRRVEALGAF